MAIPIVKKISPGLVSTTFIGDDQIHISASVTNSEMDSTEACRIMYREIANTLHQYDMHVVHERLFGSLSIRDAVLEGRRESLHNGDKADELPITYIQGHPYWGEGFSGVQVRAVREGGKVEKIWTIREEDKPVGRAWIRNGAKFIMLHDMHGKTDRAGQNNSRAAQTTEMFDRATALLKKEGATFKNTVRTWIYLSNILEWYDDFNLARNDRFKAYGLFKDPEAEKNIAEEVYMPASTGIMGDNPAGAAGTMDVFAIVPGDSNSVSIEAMTGIKQKSAYRYGSAFSRAMAVKESDCTHILVSGTASINDKGETIHLDDTRAQMQKTIEIVSTLIGTEGASLENVIDTTVFLKKPEDIKIWQDVSKANGLDMMPSVCMVADVCRSDLLFELDANVALLTKD